MKTMQAILSWIMVSRWRAAAVTFVTGAVNLLSILGGGMVALVGLRQGPIEGLAVCLLAGAGLLALSLAVGVDPLVVVGGAMTLWLPAVLVAWVLTRTRSQAHGIQASGAVGGLGVLAFYLGTEAPGERGREFVDQFLVPMAERMGEGETPDTEVLDAWAGMVPGLLGAALMVAVMVSLLLGRWWQAILYNPGGFQAEFHELRHGLVPMYVLGGIMVLAALSGQPWAMNLALIAIIVLLMQGLSVIHALVHRRGLGGFWLVPVYGLLVLLPLPVMTALAGLGIVDNVVDIRARYAPRPPEQDSDSES